MLNAADAIPLDAYVATDDCTMVASDPTESVTQRLWEVSRIAAPVFFTRFRVGTRFNLSETFDLGKEPAVSFGSLAYATVPSTLSTVGTQRADISVDVRLVADWNLVTWTPTEDGFAISARPTDETIRSMTLFSR